MVMDEEFNSLKPEWGALWWQPTSPPNSTYVQDGVLNLVSRRSQGYQDISLSTESATSSGRWKQGYFEARMRWTKGAGAWPGFWLSSYAHSQRIKCPPLNAELDIFEGQGTEPDVFYGTLHENTNSPCGVADATNDGYHPLSTDLTAAFHTYSVLWTLTDVIWYLDEVEVARTPAYASTDQELFIILQMWIGGWTSGTNASTPDELKTEVDWVHVWQK
jgi:beta-glucanase (GH16 family)